MPQESELGAAWTTPPQLSSDQKPVPPLQIRCQSSKAVEEVAGPGASAPGEECGSAKQAAEGPHCSSTWMMVSLPSSGSWGTA